MTKDHATLKSTFNLLPGSNFLTNLKNALNDPNKPVVQAMGNSFIVAAITCILSVYVASWNNYFLPQLLMDTNSKNATLPLVIAGLNAEANGNFDLGKVYMVLGIAIISLIIVYLCLSKFIIRGVALGSVKG